MKLRIFVGYHIVVPSFLRLLIRKMSYMKLDVVKIVQILHRLTNNKTYFFHKTFESNFFKFFFLMFTNTICINERVNYGNLLKKSAPFVQRRGLFAGFWKFWLLSTSAVDWSQSTNVFRIGKCARTENLMVLLLVYYFITLRVPRKFKLFSSWV